MVPAVIRVDPSIEAHRFSHPFPDLMTMHLRAATLTMDTVLGEMELVHAGPVKAFQDRVLTDMRIP